MNNGGASLPQLALAHVNVFAENNRSELGWDRVTMHEAPT